MGEPMLDLTRAILKSQAAGEIVRALIVVIALGMTGLGYGGWYFGTHIMTSLAKVETIDDRLIKIEVAREAGVANNNRRVTALEMLGERHQQELGRLGLAVERLDARIPKP